MPEVMSFYELYHVAITSIWVRSRLIKEYPKSNTEAMPLLVPDEKLMTKWLPAVRWGSLEFDQSDTNRPCLVRLDESAYSLRPWMNQSTLKSTWEGGAMTWIGASDYYRFPHVQHFHSVASLVAKLHELPLTAASFGMRSASQKIRSQTLAAYGRVLQHVLGFGMTGHTSDSSFSFNKKTLVTSVIWSETLLEQFSYQLPVTDGKMSQWGLRQLTSSGVASPNRWNQMPLGGTCKNGFITQADFVQEL